MESANKDACCEKPKVPEMTEEAPVVTRQRFVVGDREVAFRVTAGRMPMKNKQGEIEAQVFFVAYEQEDVAAGDRPLMFSFNGGPGSPSLWLHLGALGPKRVRMDPDTGMPKPPYRLEDNPQTWLEFTDLVFIDPIGTGYSRAKTLELAEKAWGLEGDIESVAEFIRLFLARHERWLSPLYIVGESYGTTRASGLSSYLLQRGIALNGIVLVSAILNFQTARFSKANDLPYILFLPTYTATAYYHGRLGEDLQSRPIREVLDQARVWARESYAPALAKGDQLAGEERAEALRQLARFTGVSEEWLDQRDLRPVIHTFCKQLLRDKRRTVGRLDSRFVGIDPHAGGEQYTHDPAMSSLMPPYTSVFNHYVRAGLGYRSDLEYQVFKGIEKPWNWGSAGEGHPDTSEALRDAMSKNPHMKVFIASGYFDLATPFFATEWTLAHAGLEPEIRGAVRTHEYEAGHMMYIHEPSLGALSRDVATFVQESR